MEFLGGIMGKQFKAANWIFWTLVHGFVHKKWMSQNFRKTWNILEIFNDIKNLNGSMNYLSNLNLLVFEWFEYVKLCGSR